MRHTNQRRFLLAVWLACMPAAWAQAPAGDPLLRRYQEHLQKAQAGDAQAQYDTGMALFYGRGVTLITETAPVSGKLPGGPPPPALGWAGAEQQYACRHDSGYVYCAQGGKDVRRFANMTKDDMDAQGYWDEFRP